jgi:hypothetical protein
VISRLETTPSGLETVRAALSLACATAARMDTDPDPRTVRQVAVEPGVPAPDDCVPPGESITTRVSLSDGWLAVTARQVLVYRTDRDPALVTVARPNVTGVAIRRSGDGPIVRYAPRIAAYGLVGVLVGLLFGALVPAAAVDIPQDSPAAGSLGFVTMLTGGLQLLGDLAVLFGAVALVGGLGALGYRLATGGRVLLVEVTGGRNVRCRSAGGNERRALRQLRVALEEPEGAMTSGADAEGDDGSIGTRTIDGESTGAMDARGDTGEAGAAGDDGESASGGPDGSDLDGDP